MTDERRPVRVFFEKSGRAVYISHLDLLRTVQRAIKRSGLPVWYSEGYNPRIYLNFPLALPVGCEGANEAVDFYTIGDIPADVLTASLNSAFPDGIHAISAAAPVCSNKDIAAAEYEIFLEGLTAADVDTFMSKESITVQKHSKKKGMVEIDIKPHITVTETTDRDDGTLVTLRLPAGNELNINAALFTDALTAEKGGCVRYTKRTKILCKDGSEFK
ncbi:MAG: DUF2344 domain-containing protein [Ruminococcus sp.]|nr:DUF2344 domain-containing protein [Ruminococcus sp.]MBQ5312106.1 TIGR03936 family radical SAM-associated protein [Oscillospiraceae bacterium]